MLFSSRISRGTQILALGYFLFAATSTQAVRAAELANSLESYFARTPEQRSEVEWSDFDELTKDQAAEYRQMIFDAAKKQAIAEGRKKRFDDREMLLDNPFGMEQKTPMQFKIITKGEKPKDGWPAYINIHGSGPVDREYSIHSKRHRHFHGKVVVPKSPHKNMPAPKGKKAGIWRHCFVPAIEAMATDLVMFEEVDPNKIYVMGFSEGGYFSYRVIPAMSDRLAGVAPAAGGGQVSPNWVDNLVNIPLYAQSGQFDNGFKRAEQFREMVKTVKALRTKYPDRVHVKMNMYAKLGHQIPDTQKQFAAPLWLIKHTRNANPDLIIWQQRKNLENHQDRKGNEEFTFPYTSNSHYWIRVKEVKGELARVEGRRNDKNEIHLITDDYSTLIVRLNDELVDFDRPVKIYFNDKLVHDAKVQRSLQVMLDTWHERQDLKLVYSAEVTVEKP